MAQQRENTGSTPGTGMTSSRDMKTGSVLRAGGEDRRRAALDQLPPPACSSKPLTPFSIEDILSRPSVRKAAAAAVAAGAAVSVCPPRAVDKVSGSSAGRPGLTTPSSPLCALEELASKTFKGLEVSVIQAAEGTRHHRVNISLCSDNTGNIGYIIIYIYINIIMCILYIYICIIIYVCNICM